MSCSGRKRRASRAKSREQGKGHHLGQQQGQHQVGISDAHVLAIGGGQVDDGVDAVNVEEKGQQEEKNLLLPPDIGQCAAQTAEAGADEMGLAGHKVDLAVGAQQWQTYPQPPDGGDDKGDGGGAGGAQAGLLRRQHQKQAGHKGDAAAQIAPGVALGGDHVHAPVIGHVGEHGVIEDQTARIAHLGHHEQRQKGQPAGGEGEHCAAQAAGQNKTQKQGLFEALVSATAPSVGPSTATISVQRAAA